MRKRILWVSILITFLGLIFFSFTATAIYYNISLEQTKEHLTVYMNAYHEGVTHDKMGAEALSERLGGARVTFLRLDGTVLADSKAGQISIDHSDREEVIAAIESGEGYAVRSSNTLGENMIYYCKKFDDVLVRIAVLNVSAWEIYVRALPSIIGFLFLEGVACFIFAYISTNFILKPVHQLTMQAQRGEKLVSRYEELKPIADVLNQRNEKIKNDFAKIQAEKELVVQAKASKDEMVANVTHEMNTPLTSIKGFAELLAGEGLTEEQRTRAVSIIRSQSQRLSNLISDIIHYSEIDTDALPSYDVDFTSLTREALKVFEPHLQEKNITLHCDIEEGITVFSRHERLTVIVNNLVGNAIRYNKEGGEIFVTLGRAGKFAKLVVSDTGMGISKENLDKIFSRFFTVDKSHNGQGGGFGLGLAAIKKLCKKAGWTINVESILNQGTTFTVVF